jgi:putative ABC transport system permease protein
MRDLGRDLCHAARCLARTPAFTASAVLVLALGIGANSAIFSVVEAVLLRPLPFARAERLVLVWGVDPRGQWPQLPLSFANFDDLRARATSFAELAAWRLTRFSLAGEGEPERAQAARVTSSFLGLLGVRPLHGRLLAPAEDDPEAAPVAVIGHALWQRRFGGDPAAVGRTLLLDGRPHAIVGVLPPGFRFASFDAATEVWVPFGPDPGRARRFARGLKNLGVVGRLRDGVALQGAAAELRALAAQLEREHPEVNTGFGLQAVPLREQAVASRRPALLVLVAAVALVLVAACANVAHLLLARAASRRREIAVRSALGASRARLVRQLLAESLLLSLLGAGAGLLVAAGCLELSRLLPPETPSLFRPYAAAAAEVRLDAGVLGFTLLLALATSALFGLAPALRATRPAAAVALRGGAEGEPRGRLRGLLLASEIAVSLVLLIGAGLLARSFARLLAVEPGFARRGVLTAELSLPAARYPDGARLAAFYDRLLARLAELPGVEAVGAGEHLPLSGLDASTGLYVDGRPEPPPGEAVYAHYRSVSPDYFAALGMALVRGRGFAGADDAGAARVAVVSESLAARLWPGEEPLGKRLALDFEAMKFFPDRPPQLDVAAGMREVVGVLRDVRHAGPDAAPLPEMYVPLAQRPVRELRLVLGADPRRGDARQLAGALAAAVRELDPLQPVGTVRTMERLYGDATAARRFNLALLGAFAALALALALAGVYGVLSYLVASQTRAIGVRVALGAGRADILRLVVGRAARPTAGGLAAGVVATLALTRWMSSLLFGVASTDVATYTAAAALLGAAALAASLVPARRAMGIDPAQAMRSE